MKKQDSQSLPRNHNFSINKSKDTRIFEMYQVKDLLPKIMNDFNDLKKKINR